MHYRTSTPCFAFRLSSFTSFTHILLSCLSFLSLHVECLVVCDSNPLFAGYAWNIDSETYLLVLVIFLGPECYFCFFFLKENMSFNSECLVSKLTSKNMIYPILTVFSVLSFFLLSHGASSILCVTGMWLCSPCVIHRFPSVSSVCIPQMFCNLFGPS